MKLGNCKIVRSFDINKPGTPFAQMRGGVLGGTVMNNGSGGEFRINDDIIIRPGLKINDDTYKPFKDQHKVDILRQN